MKNSCSSQPDPTQNGSCPHVDANHHDCAPRLTLQRLDEAFTFCLGGRHHQCPVYQALAFREQDHAPLFASPSVASEIDHSTRRLDITIQGKALEAHLAGRQSAGHAQAKGA